MKQFIENIKDICILIVIIYASPLHGWMLEKFGGVICLTAIVVVLLSILLKYTKAELSEKIEKEEED